MNCCNHTEREAVATCQTCGKGLCRECAEKYTPCMCGPCAVQTRCNQQQQAQNKKKQRKQKYKDTLVDIRIEFIKTAVTGIFAGTLFIWHEIAQKNDDTSFADCASLFFGGFCIPFGWKFITYLQSFFPVSLFGTFWFWVIHIGMKAILSAFVGIPAFIYELAKMILTERKMNRLK